LDCVQAANKNNQIQLYFIHLFFMGYNKKRGPWNPQPALVFVIDYFAT